jgi:HK97 gp10 family phage protein
MPMPKSVTKISKDGVSFTSNVDAVQYTIKELSRAALRDVGKLLRKDAKSRVPVDTGNLKKNIGTWVRKSDDGGAYLQVGVYDRKRAQKKGMPYAFYAHMIEFGTSEHPANPFIKPSAMNNLTAIQQIEAKYLSALSGTVSKDFDESEEIKDD